MNYLNSYPKNLMPDKIEFKSLNDKASYVIKVLKDILRSYRVKAEVFVGGSFAKGTLLKKDKYDIDIFVRFYKNEDMSNKLEKIVKEASLRLESKYVRIHGSRDYFSINYEGIEFEIVPVLFIKKPKEAENVTDLSYFHVKYVRKALKEGMRNEVAIAKAFCKAQEVYGAESWIGGFSGYALECLIIYYKSFIKFLKSTSNANLPIIIDIEKYYSSKQSILRSLQEGKLQGPIIFIDPTYKERNVAGALRKESFKKFQEATKKYLKHPSSSFFEKKRVDYEYLKKKLKNKEEIFRFCIYTEKQEGDIAGSKLLKGFNYIVQGMQKRFEIKDKIFEYDDTKEANGYLIVKPKEFIEIKGPSLKMKKHAEAFKKMHKNAFVKQGRLCVKEVMNKSANEYLSEFIRKYDKQMKEMGISSVNIN